MNANETDKKFSEWHSIEREKIDWHPTIDETKCIGCDACFKVCPVTPKVIEIVEIEGRGKKSVIVHPEACDFGGACVKVCPTRAFQLTKDW